MVSFKRRNSDSWRGPAGGLRGFAGRTYWFAPITACLLAGLSFAACGPARSGPPEVCDLSDDRTLFRCDVPAREGPPDCRPDAIGDQTRRRFLEQMTTVSIGLLFLEGAPGARGPFDYNDTAAVLDAVGVELCQVRDDRCSCRLTYRRPQLGELFRDAAQCKTDSKFQDDPLYFRGRGCRR